MELARIDLQQMIVVPDGAPGAAVVQRVLPPDTWADLTDRGYPRVGYWPIVDVVPTYNPLTQELGAPVVTVDEAQKRVTRTPIVTDLPAQQAAANQGAATYNALIAGGLRITSTGTQAINGTYSADPQTRADMQGVVSYIQQHNAFPANRPALPVPVAGGAVIVPSPAAYLAIATAIADFVTAAILAKNIGSAWPSASVTIA